MTVTDVRWFTDTASWALILGVLTPLLVSVVQQPKWSQQVRAVVAAVAAIVVGLLTVLANGGFNDASGVLGIVALVLVASNTAYKTLWKPMGVAPMIEAKTSPGGAHVITTVETEQQAVAERDLPSAEAPPRRYDERGTFSAMHALLVVLVVAVLVVVLVRLL
jgi:hypothetical protein